MITLSPSEAAPVTVTLVALTAPSVVRLAALTAPVLSSRVTTACLKIVLPATTVTSSTSVTGASTSSVTSDVPACSDPASRTDSARSVTFGAVAKVAPPASSRPAPGLTDSTCSAPPISDRSWLSRRTRPVEGAEPSARPPSVTSMVVLEVALASAAVKSRSAAVRSVSAPLSVVCRPVTASPPVKGCSVWTDTGPADRAEATRTSTAPASRPARRSRRLAPPSTTSPLPRSRSSSASIELPLTWETPAPESIRNCRADTLPSVKGVRLASATSRPVAPTVTGAPKTLAASFSTNTPAPVTGLGAELAALGWT